MGWDVTIRTAAGSRSVHFAGMARQRQEKHYGFSFTDCISYGPDGDDEKWGSISDPEGGGFWRPRVDRGIERCERLLAAVREKPTHPQDEERVVALLAGLRDLKADRYGMVSMSF